MISNIQKITQGEALLTWACAEYGKWGQVDPGIRAKIASGVALTLGEQNAAVRRLLEARVNLLTYLLWQPTLWYVADAGVNGFAQLRILYEVSKRTSTHSFGELVLKLPSETNVLGFDLGKMKGRPILVGKTVENPATLLDGYHRLGEILRMGSAYPRQTVEVMVAACETFDNWC